MTEDRIDGGGVRIEEVVDHLDIQDEATQVYLDRDTR